MSVFLSMLLIINLLLTLYVVFVEHRNYASTWAWIMVMNFIPILGFILYLFVGHNIRKKKMFHKKEQEDTYLYMLHRQSHQLKDPCCCFLQCCLLGDAVRVLKLHLLGHQVLYTTQNNVQLFSKGVDKFEALFHEIQSAKSRIHIEYYIIRDDTLGNQFKALLIQKAQEGVDIKLLYDGMGCIHTSKRYFQELREGGVQVECFYPPLIAYINFRVNYRNHRKLCIIDDNKAFIGGFNIGDEYLGKHPKFGEWRDTHLLITGEAARLMDLQFLLDWSFATKTSFPLDHLMHLEPLVCHPHSCTPIQIVSSGPDSKYPTIEHGYIQLITTAKRSIQLQTPYFVPNEPLLTALKLAALSGIDVSIMIPNKPDHLFVYWATYSYIGEILACGAKCYLYQPGFLHAKTLVIDECVASVGTANFDIRSFKVNFEINAFVYHPTVATQLSKLFYEDLAHCVQLTEDLYSKRSLAIRFKEALGRLLSPLL